MPHYVVPISLFVSGFINGLGMITAGTGGAIVVGVIMLFIALLFGLMAVADMIVLIKVLLGMPLFSCSFPSCYAASSLHLLVICRAEEFPRFIIY